MSTVEAGWYSDPWEDGKIRYWDGVTWTDEQYDAEDSEYDVHGAEDPAPPVDHTVAPSSVLQAQGMRPEGVAPAQDPGAPANGGAWGAQTPSAPSAPGYGQMPPSAPSAPGYGQMPQSAPSAPGYGPMTPSAPSAPGYGPMPPSAPSAPGYGPMAPAPGQGQMPPSAPSAPGYGPMPPSAPSAPGYGPGQQSPQASGWSAGSSPETSWAGQTGPGFYNLPGAGSPSSTGPVAGSGHTAPMAAGVYGDYPAAGAGGYASGGVDAYGQGPAWAGSPPSAGGPPPQQYGTGYTGPQKRSGVSPAILAVIGVVVVAALGVGSYFLFFAGDDDEQAGTGGGGGGGTGGGGTTTVEGGLSFVDSTGAEVPESGTVQVPADGAWEGTITVEERTGFLVVAAEGATDPQIAISGPGVSVDVDDVGQGGRSVLESLGSGSGLDAAAGLVLEPGEYTIQVTDWRNNGGSVPLEYRTGLVGTLTSGSPVDVSVPANDVAIVAVEPGAGSGSVHTVSPSGVDPRLMSWDPNGDPVDDNDDGTSLAPSDIGSQMNSLDSYVETSGSSPFLVVVGTWRDRGGDMSVTYNDR